jgi:hypothetical protein
MFKLLRVKAVTPYKVTGTVHDTLCVGRAPQSDLCVMDRLISANHARLSLKGHTLQVTDLDSRNGTEVNGLRLKPFSPHTLRQGDVLDFAGRLALRLHVTPSDALPILQVEPDDAPRQPPDPTRSSGSILRLLRLPTDASPNLKPDRWAALCALGASLNRRALQADPSAWLEQLCARGAAALGVSQLQLLRLLDGRPARVAPEHGACRVRAEPIEELTLTTQRHDPQNAPCVVGVELLSGDLDALDLQETFDASTPNDAAPPQIITLHLGALWVDGSLWGALYATNELSGRRRPLDPQDLWALDALCAFTSAALEGVIASQTLRHAHASIAALGPAAATHPATKALASLSPQPHAPLSPRAARLLLPEPPKD